MKERDEINPRGCKGCGDWCVMDGCAICTGDVLCGPCKGGYRREKTVRPTGMTDEILEFLDELRASGEINMCGAAEDLRWEYEGLDKKTSRAFLKYWIQTFGEEIR